MSLSRVKDGLGLFIGAQSASMERNGVNWSSRMSFSRVKHGLGLFIGAQYASSGYDERVNNVK